MFALPTDLEGAFAGLSDDERLRTTVWVLVAISDGLSRRTIRIRPRFASSWGRSSPTCCMQTPTTQLLRVTLREASGGDVQAATLALLGSARIDIATEPAPLGSISPLAARFAAMKPATKR